MMRLLPMSHATRWTTGLRRWLPRSLLRCLIVVFGQPIGFSERFPIIKLRERITPINQRIVASIATPQSFTACSPARV